MPSETFCFRRKSYVTSLLVSLSVNNGVTFCDAQRTQTLVFCVWSEQIPFQSKYDMSGSAVEHKWLQNSRMARPPRSLSWPYSSLDVSATGEGEREEEWLVAVPSSLSLFSLLLKAAPMSRHFLETLSLWQNPCVTLYSLFLSTYSFTPSRLVMVSLSSLSGVEVLKGSERSRPCSVFW